MGDDRMDHTLRRWTRLASREAYASPWTRLREDTVVFPNGEESTYSVFELGSCAGVLPLLDDGRVVMVRQYRYIGDHFPWEMPTGAIDHAESPAEAANRELAEEAGYRAAVLDYLGPVHTSKGHCEEVAHLFIGRELTPVAAAPEPTEEIEIRPFAFEEVLRMVLDGQIVDSMTVIAVLRAALSDQRRLSI
ncbi:MAG: NUDIX hydrolase [Chloroflexota bacterium]